MSETMEQKLDKLMGAVSSISDEQKLTKRDLEERFKKLEEDVAASHEDATERALKRVKRDRPLEFKRKGHEEQYVFNAEIGDRIEAAVRKIKKINAPTEKDAKTAQEALNELREGIEALAERQKLIRIADQSKNSWRAVAAYKAGGLGDNEEDNKKIRQADRDAEPEVSRERKESLPERQKRAQFPQPQPFQYYGPQWYQPGPPPPPPPPPMGFHPPPPRQQQPTSIKSAGQCFNCFQFGHYRANCPRLGRPQYPLINDVCVNTDVWGDIVCGSNIICTQLGNNTGISGGDAMCTGTMQKENVGHVGITKSLVETACQGGSVDKSQSNKDCHTSYVASSVDHPNNVRNNSAYLGTEAQGSVDKSLGNTVGSQDFKTSYKVVHHTAGGEGDSGTSKLEKIAVSCCDDQESAEYHRQIPNKSNGDMVASQESSHEGQISQLGDWDQSDIGPDCQPITVFWEIEQGESRPQVSDVQGRLSNCLKFWEEALDPAPWIISCISEGYKLPFRTLPNKYSRPNQKSALDNKEFVLDAIQELEKNRCITRVFDPPYICSPLSVVSNSSGKLRLVLNLRYLNQFLWLDRFKYEDMRTAMTMFQKGDYVFSFDLKSGYHHIDIYEPHRRYLGFSWVVHGTTQYFVFAVLPFGLASACYAFTKLLRPLIRYWRGQGLRALLYLDDGIVAVSGKSAAVEASHRVRSDLRRAGLVEHTAKCSWVPSQQASWLGFDLNLEQGVISIPEGKIASLKSQLDQAVATSCVKARQLASIIGKIIAMSLAVGPVSRLMTRSMYSLLNSRQYWCQVLALNTEVLEEMYFWLQNIDGINGREIWHSPSALRVVYSDASDTGYGGFTVEHGCYVAHGAWSADESLRSSTWRELKAVRMVLESLLPKLQNQRIRWFSDNQNVVRILDVGSKNPLLQKEALGVFAMASQNLIRIEPEWIPRSQNQQADYLSRIQDSDDWALQPLIFQEIDRAWGPHTVDRFADHQNTKLPRFNSRCWCPGTEAVDTFTCDWGQDTNWVCPPPYLVPRVIRHAQATQARGTLIVPYWLSAPYWPMIYPDGSIADKWVKSCRVFSKELWPIIPGKSGCTLPVCDMLAVKFDFKSQLDKQVCANSEMCGSS